MHGDSQGKAIPRGASRDSTLFQYLPIQWTVVDIAIGGGADGEGEHPPPLFLSIPDINSPQSSRMKILKY